MPPGFGGLMNSPPSDPLLLGLSCVAALSLLYLLLVFRPRTKGGSTAPPVVTSSPVSKLPVIGTIVEFATSPVKLVQRCYEDYGPVFTVPVSPRQHLAEPMPMTNDVSQGLCEPMLVSSTRIYFSFMYEALTHFHHSQFLHKRLTFLVGPEAQVRPNNCLRK